MSNINKIIKMFSIPTPYFSFRFFTLKKKKSLEYLYPCDYKNNILEA